MLKNFGERRFACYYRGAVFPAGMRHQGFVDVDLGVVVVVDVVAAGNGQR
jgi:hypothetical protein